MWGQWQGGVTIAWQGQQIDGIATVSIDEDQSDHGVASFGAQHGDEFAAGIAGITLLVRRIAVDASGVQEWRSNESLVFDRNFNAFKHGQEFGIGERRIRISPVAPVQEGFDSISIEVRDTDDALVAGGVISDPGVDHPALRLEAEDTDWASFRAWALEYSAHNPGVVYRGHSSNSQRLVTTFHRHHRRNLVRYGVETLGLLAHDYQNFSGERIDIQTDSHDFSRLLALARHHAYPTPILDWTLSPFVAAYFAFRDYQPHEPGEAKARLFCLDPDRIGMRRRPSLIIDPRPCIQTLPLTDRGNPRGPAQQSRYLFTNVANVEALIMRIQQEPAMQGEGIRMPQDVKVWDIPRSERAAVMRDLRLMGVTASSLFPGIGGFFDAARERHF